MVNVLQVEYCVETFCDKNRDELPKESDELFASSSNPFVVHLFVPPGGECQVVLSGFLSERSCYTARAKDIVMDWLEISNCVAVGCDAVSGVFYHGQLRLGSFVAVALLLDICSRAKMLEP